MASTRHKHERPRLTGYNRELLARNLDPTGLGQRQSFAQQMNTIREEGVRRWYTYGGKLFLRWVKQNYKTYNGESLNWTEPYQEEIYLAIGNPWLEKLVIEKSAQQGFTESMVALAAFSMAELRSSAGFGVEQERKLFEIGPRIQQAFDFIVPIQTLKATYRESAGRDDTDSKTRKLTVAGVSLNLFYTSTSAASKKQAGGRQAGSGLSSFPANIMIGDEFELWSSSSLDVARRRQDACTWPTKPFRIGSTPGGEGGALDVQLKMAKYLFQWSVECPYCEHRQFLDAFGNLLKATVIEEDGITDVRHVDMLGRPLNWFCRDSTSMETRIQTAYIGCEHCQEELTRASLDAGYYLCRKTGVKLRELSDRIVREHRPVKEGVGLRYPKLANVRFSAPDTIQELILTMNPADAIQQMLGRTVSLGGGKINMKRLMDSVGRPLPAGLGSYNLTVLGLDQGHAANIVVIQRWWLDETIDDFTRRWSEAFKETIWSGYVQGGFEAIDRLVEDYQVDVIGMDGEPEVQKAGDYARLHPHCDGDKGQVYLMDQVNLKGEPWKKANKDIQGQDVATYRIHRSWALDAVQRRIYRSLHRLPPGSTYNPKEKNALLYQYTTSERLTDGRWTETPGEPDHYLHADGFAEAAAVIHLFEPGNSGFFFGVLRRK